MLGPRAADLASIVPDIRERIADLERPPELSPDQAWFRNFESCSRVFRDASARRPLFILLDDLQFGDPASIRLAEFLARTIHETSILLLVTSRDLRFPADHPMTILQGTVASERACPRLRLAGLDETEIVTMPKHP